MNRTPTAGRPAGRNPSPVPRLSTLWLPLLALALALAAGCSIFPGGKPKVMSHTSSNALRTPDSLPLDVVEYSWQFLNNGRHLRLMGRVRNDSAEVYQGVSLLLSLRDENGAEVAKSLAHVYPAYLPPKAEGSFETVAMTPSPGRNLPAGRLETTARVER